MKRVKLLAVTILTTLLTIGFLFSEDIIHVVQKGDTLYSLAKKYDISVSDICAYNNITDASKVKSGQKIKIPQKAAVSSISSSASSKGSSEPKTYKVESGDTLFSIAKKYNTTVDEIRKENGMTSKSVLKSGQIVKIPSKTSVSTYAVLSTSGSDEKENPFVPLSDPRSYKTKSVDSKLAWPVKTTEVSYVSGKTNSVVLQGDKGDNVTAVRAGKVIFSGLFRGSGLVVFIQPKASDYVYVYSGLGSTSVQKGDSVEYGAVLGTLGVDTINQKPQLNFMVFKNGSAIDPAKAPRG